MKILYDTSMHWELTCDGLMFHPGGVDDSHSLSTMKNGDKHRPYMPSWFGEGFNFIYMNVQVPLLTCPLTILLQMVSELVTNLCKLSDRCPCTPSVCYRSCWGTGPHSQVNPASAPSVLVNSCQQSLYSVNKINIKLIILITPLEKYQ